MKQSNTTSVKEFLKKYVLVFFILCIEVVSIARMGYDTFQVIEGDLFTRITTTLTVDGIMAGSIFFVAYMPNITEKIRTEKYLMSVLAWVMFSVQVIIGYQAGGLAGLASRIGMGAILVLHTGTYIAQRIRTYRASHTNTYTPQETRRNARSRAWNIGYRVGTYLLLPFVIVFGVIEQVLLLLFEDMLLRVLRSAKDVNVSVGVNTPHSTTLLTHTSRAKDIHNISYMITSGEHANKWMCECDLCGELNIHDTSTQASRAYAGHSTANKHKILAAQAEQTPLIIEQST